ncbi:Uncharacterised protein r2_g3280 [Pycnogonum litorale]
MVKMSYEIGQDEQQLQIEKPEKAKSRKILNCKSTGVGLFLANLSSFFYVCSEILVKLVSPEISSTEIVFFIYVIQFIFFIPYLFYLKYNPEIIKHSARKWLLIISAALFLSPSIYLNYQGLRYMSVLDSLVIINSRIAIVAFLAFVFLKESVDCYDILCIIMAIFGVILVCRPTFIFGSTGGSNSLKYLGAIFALSTAFTNSFHNLLVRYLQGVHPSVILMLQPFISSIIGGIIFASNVEQLRFPSNKYDVIFLCAICVVLTTANALLLVAMKHVDATPLAVVLSMQIPYGFLMQWAILSKLPSFIGLWGTILGLVSSLMVSIKPYVLRLLKNKNNANESTILLETSIKTTLLMPRYTCD